MGTVQIEIFQTNLKKLKMFHTRQPTLFNMDPMFYRPVQPVRLGRRNSPEKVLQSSPEEPTYIEIPIQRASIVDEQLELSTALKLSFIHSKRYSTKSIRYRQTSENYSV